MNEDYMDEVRKIGTCEECSEDIYDDNSRIYVDDDGNLFCSLECCLNYYGIRRVDDFSVIGE